MNIIEPILFFSALGLGAGVLLAAASKIFNVKTDERVEKLTSALPGINCGACGFSGCEGYANAIAKDGAALNLCKTGGAQTLAEISEIMGVEAAAAVPEKAVVRCSGDCEAAGVKYDFEGVKSCAAAEIYYSGYKKCTSGCLGLGDCIKVCPQGAISIKDGIAVVDECKCVGCGICLRECPNGLIALRPVTNKVDYLCMSKNTAKDTVAACKNGCIGCRQCERVCPERAVKVENNHAELDYSKCISCGKCAEVCKRGVISMHICTHYPPLAEKAKHNA